jgi:hypothetical protein
MAQEDDEAKSDEPAGEAEMKVPRVGDTVEVEALPGKWVRGKVTRIVGGIPCPALEVEHDPYGDGRLRSLVFFCKSFRPATNATKGNNTAPKKVGSGLTLGTYGCSEKERRGSQWVFNPRGSFTLRANGKYTQTRGGGSYKYNAAAQRNNFYRRIVRQRKRESHQQRTN